MTVTTPVVDGCMSEVVPSDSLFPVLVELPLPAAGELVAELVGELVEELVGELVEELVGELVGETVGELVVAAGRVPLHFG